MKKHLVTAFVVLSMMAMLVGTVGAAPKAAGTTFLGAIYTTGGATFTFTVDESLSRRELRATVLWDGGSVGITCSQDGNTVTCSAPRSVVDKNITISFQGMNFATYVKSQAFCYGVYDWNNPGPYTNWVNYGTYCQDDGPSYGDVITWDNPVFGPSGYEFLPSSPTCFTEDIIGNSYYYGCPF